MQRREFLITARNTGLYLLAGGLSFNLVKYLSGQSVWMPSKFKDVSYLAWLIHPEFDDKKALEMWGEFLSDVQRTRCISFA